MDVVGYTLKKTYFKDKKCFSCGFWGHKSTHCRRKNKNLEKKRYFQKNVQCPVENRNKKFND